MSDGMATHAVIAIGEDRSVIVTMQRGRASDGHPRGIVLTFAGSGSWLTQDTNARRNPV
jgi:hypothetical protein